jgi:beta-glucosidase
MEIFFLINGTKARKYGTPLQEGMLAMFIRAADSNSPALYLDASQPVDSRVADLISRLTLEEKATLLNHVGPTVARFNIRSDQWNQCLNGVQSDHRKAGNLG